MRLERSVKARIGLVILLVKKKVAKILSVSARIPIQIKKRLVRLVLSRIPSIAERSMMILPLSSVPQRTRYSSPSR